MTPKQLIERRSYMGASDVAAALGVSPYRTPHDVWMEKMGLPMPPVDSEPIRCGVAMEPYVLARYEVESGLTILPSEPIVHPVETWARATPDGVITGESPRLIEVKCVTPYTDKSWENPWDGVTPLSEYVPTVPTTYLIQAVWQMFCTGCNRCDIVRWPVSNTRPLEVYPIVYREAIEARIVRDASAWWTRHIIEGEEPERVTTTWTDPTEPDKLIEPEPGSDLAQLIERVGELHAAYSDAQSEAQGLEVELKELKAMLHLHVGGAKGFRLNGVEVKRQKNKSVSYAKILATLPDGTVPPETINAYTTEGTTWRVYHK